MPVFLSLIVIALYGEFIVFIDDSENLENRSGNKFVSHRCQYFLSERHALMMLRIPRMIEHTKHKIGRCGRILNVLFKSCNEKL